MEQLTTHHSLYLISKEELKEFKILYTRWKDVLPPLSVKIHNDEDTLATVLNSWVILNRYPAFAIKKEDKRFSYICNDYIHDLLNHSADIARIVQLWKNNKDRLFILSYYLALHILNWVEFALLNENEEIANAIFKVCKRRNYYVHRKNNLLPISNEAIYIKQRLVTSLLKRDNNSTNRMNKIIEKAILETNEIFQINKSQLVPK